MSGVPNNIELLFLEKEDYIMLDEYGEELLKIRDSFLSKQVMKRFGGYAKSQAQKMQNLKSNGAARVDLIEAYGYDTKFYMHTVRLLQMAIEILKNGTFRTKRYNAEFLISLRKGRHTLDEALGFIELLEKDLEQSYLNSFLPEQPDHDFINNWLVNLNKKYIDSKEEINNG